jgi:hypothetical protein
VAILGCGPERAVAHGIHFRALLEEAFDERGVAIAGSLKQFAVEEELLEQGIHGANDDGVLASTGVRRGDDRCSEVLVDKVAQVAVP